MLKQDDSEFCKNDHTRIKTVLEDAAVCPSIFLCFSLLSFLVYPMTNTNLAGRSAQQELLGISLSINVIPPPKVCYGGSADWFCWGLDLTNAGIRSEGVRG